MVMWGVLEWECGGGGRGGIGIEVNGWAGTDDCWLLWLLFMLMIVAAIMTSLWFGGFVCGAVDKIIVIVNQIGSNRRMEMDFAMG